MATIHCYISNDDNLQGSDVSRLQTENPITGIGDSFIF